MLLLAHVGTLGNVAQHGEDSALNGLAHGGKGHLDGTAERRCDDSGVGGTLDLGQALGQTAKNLARNDAGVAAGAHEGTVRHGSCELGHRGVGRQRLNLRDDRG